MKNLEILSKNQVVVTASGITDNLYNEFISFIDAKPKTIATYTRALRQFFAFLKNHGITHPKREDVIAFREELLLRNKPTTVQNYIVTVRLFFRWLEQMGIYKNIADKIKSPTISKAHKKDYLTSKQVKAILEHIASDTTEQGIRDYAIFAVMVVGGLRTIEIARSNISDVRNVGDNTVLFIQGKGRDEKTDYIKLPFFVERAVRRYLKLRNGESNEPLFVSTSNNNLGQRLTTRSISGIIKSRLKEAGYNSEMLTAHSLRHTAGTLNLLNGGSLEETQQLLRHSNINTTMIYLHHMERAKNMSEERIANVIF
ncbi:putative phage integrase [Candidatus Megaera venefica]|uniref:Phage integrase n=1 Tax=Candidatus Megaera venefica TaxID=2055910 RepID=A0ABU5NEU4_9RICK|nr:tyrosine-type recombinase/integrase [Candidatus Megaera venefica]MEA0971685.1 putative phage integrase [Candidatus Megaera venefica]